MSDLNIEDDDTDLALDDSQDDDSREGEDRGDNLTPSADEVEEKPEVKEEAKAEPAEEKEEVKAEEPKHAMIPKSRLDEVIAQRNAERERVERLEAELRARDQSRSAASLTDEEIQQKNRLFITKLMEGDEEAAASLRLEIDQSLMRKAAEEMTARTQYAQAVSSLQEASESVVQEFPFLDTPEGADALELIVIARDAAIAKGKSPALALLEAARKIAPRFSPVENTDRGTTEVTPKTDSRTQQAIDRGLKDSLRQPAAPQGVGNRAAPVANVRIEDMTEEQFESLTLEQKRKMRGD